MQMTYDQYIQNPMGIANAVFSNRDMYRNLYMTKLDKIMVREMGKIDYKLYKSSSKYYVYIKIPSETIEKFYYDVVIEFSEPKEKSLIDTTLKNYLVRFYSNDPSFVYTFAHAFIRNGMFINELKDVMSPEAIQQRAIEKNPSNQVGYVKSLYFAYLLLKKENVFNKTKFIIAKDIKWEDLIKSITPANTKIAQRQNAQLEKAAKNRRVKKAVEDAKKRVIERDIPLATKAVQKTSATKIIKNMTTSKKTKRTKKI